MNFLNRFFSTAKEQFQKLPINDSSWTVLTWNWDLASIDDRRMTLELNSESHFKVIWNKKEVIFIKDDKVRAFPHQDKQELKDLFSLSRHLSLKTSIESHQGEMRKTSEGDLAAETRSLQWIQASFKTLQGALQRIKEDPQLIFTCAVFSGVNPQLQQRVLRVICFNLDINYFMLDDESLRIVVYNDKNQGHGSQAAPSFHQIIRLTKPLFYDEITKLLQQVTAAGELVD